MVPNPAPHPKPTHLIPVLLLVLFAVLLINCGGDSADSTGPPAPGQDSTNTPTGAASAYDLEAVREYAEESCWINSEFDPIPTVFGAWEALRHHFRTSDARRDLVPPPVLRQYHQAVILSFEEPPTEARFPHASGMVGASAEAESSGSPSPSQALSDIYDGLPSEVRETIEAVDC